VENSHSSGQKHEIETRLKTTLHTCTCILSSRPQEGVKIPQTFPAELKQTKIYQLRFCISNGLLYTTYPNTAGVADAVQLSQVSEWLLQKNNTSVKREYLSYHY